MMALSMSFSLFLFNRGCVDVCVDVCGVVNRGEVGSDGPSDDKRLPSNVLTCVNICRVEIAACEQL